MFHQNKTECADFSDDYERLVKRPTFPQCFKVCFWVCILSRHWDRSPRGVTEVHAALM